MNSNKKTTLLFIIIFIIFIVISIYLLKSKNDSSTINIEENKEQKTELTPIEKPQKIETPKTETEIKIPISQARFDEIKNYILSLDDISLPSGLSTNEKTEIEKIRNLIKPILEKSQKKINDEQKKIDDYKKKLNEIETQKIELAKQTQTNQIKIEIQKLESKKTMYNDMLKRLENYKKELEERFNDIGNQHSINFFLNKIYQITN